MENGWYYNNFNIANFSNNILLNLIGLIKSSLFSEQGKNLAQNKNLLFNKELEIEFS